MSELITRRNAMAHGITAAALGSVGALAASNGEEIEANAAPKFRFKDFLDYLSHHLDDEQPWPPAMGTKAWVAALLPGYEDWEHGDGVDPDDLDEPKRLFLIEFEHALNRKSSGWHKLNGQAGARAPAIVEPEGFRKHNTIEGDEADEIIGATPPPAPTPP